MRRYAKEIWVSFAKTRGKHSIMAKPETNLRTTSSPEGGGLVGYLRPMRAKMPGSPLSAHLSRNIASSACEVAPRRRFPTVLYVSVSVSVTDSLSHCLTLFSVFFFSLTHSLTLLSLLSSPLLSSLGCFRSHSVPLVSLDSFFSPIPSLPPFALARQNFARSVDVCRRLLPCPLCGKLRQIQQPEEQQRVADLSTCQRSQQEAEGKVACAPFAERLEHL